MPRVPYPSLQSRRRVLQAGGAALVVSALGMPALANNHDGAFRRILAQGRIRFGSAIWFAQLPAPNGLAPLRPQDPFHAALAADIATALGLRHSFDHPGRVFEGAARLEAGEVDVVLGPMLNRLAARRLMFTTPYAQLETVLLSARPGVGRRLEHWRGHRIGMQEGFSAHLENLGFEVRAVAPHPYADLGALAAALASGAMEAVITTNITARSIMARHPGLGLGIRGSLTPHLHGAAVRLGEHELLHAIGTVLGATRESGKLARLFEQHTGARLPPPMEGS